jgi:hypothetical protein
MTRQLINKAQKPKNSALLPPADRWRLKTINQTNLTSTVEAIRQQIGTSRFPETGSHFNHDSSEGFSVEDIEDPSAFRGESFLHDFSEIPVHAKGPAKIQAKLMINAQGDAYEHEADLVSDQIMNMSRLQPGISRFSKKPDHFNLARLSQQQASQTNDQHESLSLAIHDTLRDPGQSIDGSARSFMEARFGHDFSQVRVHSDERAASSAAAVNACAYTLGNDIAFGAGMYKPSTWEGKRLLAHELVHVVQQDAFPSQVVQRQQLYPPVPIILLCRRRRPNGSVTPFPGVQVTWAGNQINIRARLQFSGPEANAQVAEAMVNDIERVWNATFSDGYGSTCQVDAQLGGPEDRARGQIIVDRGHVGGSYVSWLPPRHMNFYMGSPADLIWSPAHEFSHLLGLEDRRTSSPLSHLPFYPEIFGAEPETSEPGYERNIMGAIPEGDPNRKTELVLESRNIRDWLDQYATESVPCPSRPSREYEA